LAHARELHERGLALAQEFTFGFSRWLACEVVVDRYHAGEWDQALEEIDAQLARSQASFFMESVLLGLRGHMFVARGDLAGALSDVERALEQGRESVEHQTLCPALGDYAFCYHEAGRLAAPATAV